jgi:hypothetical protein
VKERKELKMKEKKNREGLSTSEQDTGGERRGERGCKRGGQLFSQKAQTRRKKKKKGGANHSQR